LGLGVPAPTARLDAVGSSVGVRGVSTNTGTGGRGVVGVAPSGYGVQGTSTNNVGVQGEGSIGVSGVGSDYGLWGEGSLYGGYFTSSSYGSFGRGTYCGAYGSATDYGVIGTATTVGVYGYGTTGVSGYSSDSNAGNAVLGSGGQYGVHGREGRTAGVRGDSGYVGVWGEGASLGVYGSSSATTGQVYGVYGTTASPGGYAIFSQGRMHVNGTLSKVAGSFRIDHPLDPDNTWLSHSFVESPDMMNVYNGNVVTDATGNATVTLPSYFEALNRDFRYQLTVIGVFAQAVISREVAKGSFDISTDKPKVKVSWQVTGIRQDAYAKEHPIVVETAKTGPERGTRQFTSSTARGATAFPGPDAGGDSIVPEPPKPLPTQQPNDLVPKGSKPSVTKEP
ncbi:MAG: hypothetical protein Q7T71_05115, partial [Herbiconiux sp.]|nr:hypothetical protein [Herbiconiux sp.]